MVSVSDDPGLHEPGNQEVEVTAGNGASEFESESDILAETDALKVGGNELFKSNKFDDALVEYQKALETCPESSKNVMAILYANMAACYIQLKDYEKTVQYCTDALNLDASHEKARTRRSVANEQINTLTSLQAACDDLNVLIADRQAAAKDVKELSKRLSSLEPRLQSMQKKETDKVIGQLKDLGNGLLKNFGMSLDDFKLQDDGKGGYSVNINK
jgi:tetratricopeptide (TPR) repeat protein